MQLTRHTDYALRLLIYLAVHDDEPATVQTVSDAYGISANHMAKVAQTLTQLGYVHSLRGRGGGLLLAVSPGAVNVGRLVRETEQTLALVECFEPEADCPIEPACKLKHVLKEAQEAFFESLNGYTLADLIGKRKKLTALLVSGREV